jgi:hypothetical protein
MSERSERIIDIVPFANGRTVPHPRADVAQRAMVHR